MSSRKHQINNPIVGAGTPYRDIIDLVQDRYRIELLAQALDISPRNIRKDRCSQFTISGNGGQLQTFDRQEAYLLYIMAPSSRKWGAIKRKAVALGWEVTQDGDDEGCFRLPLPNPDQAKFLRSLLGLRKRRRESDEMINSKGVSAV
jgi:hypothetical protein